MRPIAVLDTSIIILLVTSRADDSREEQENDRKRLCAREALADMQKKWRVVIPTVVIAEISRSGQPDSELEKLVLALGRFRVEPFGNEAAKMASRMAQPALASRPPGAERGAIKYDVLICGTAIACGAARIVTENPRDFRKHLDDAGAAALEVYVPSRPEPSGQIKLLQKAK